MTMYTAQEVTKQAYTCMGWPYVFGTYGQMCTPQVRRQYAGYHPEYKSNIYSACPVLSGQAASCAGCKWEGVRCFDCRGFTRWLLEQVGLSLAGGGATSQYDTNSNWAVKGEIKDMPPDAVCCVFKRRDGKMSHTGMHVGGGRIIHCSTVVKEGSLKDTPAWTHYGIPKGLYTDEELEAMGVRVTDGDNIPTLRKGSEGELVKSLQEYLNDEQGAGLTVDGKFGAKTEEAVKAFQRAHGLTADGIVGTKTWEAMGGAPEDEPEEPDGWPEEPEPAPDEWPEDTIAPVEPEQHPPDNRFVMIPREWLEVIADTLEDMAMDIRGYTGGGDSGS